MVFGIAFYLEFAKIEDPVSKFNTKCPGLNVSLSPENVNYAH